MFYTKNWLQFWVPTLSLCTYWFDQLVLERIIRKIWRTNKTGNSFNAIVNKNNIGAIINTRENHKTFIQIGISSFSKKLFRSMFMLLSPRLVQMIVTHQSSYANPMNSNDSGMPPRNWRERKSNKLQRFCNYCKFFCTHKCR